MAAVLPQQKTRKAPPGPSKARARPARRLTAEQALEIATNMVPQLAQRAKQAESLRRVPQETIDELRD
ncbi:MAG: hypothetical protein VW257_11075, partial [Quisquiliibacterium sp.]